MSAQRVRFAERQVLLWILAGFMLAFAVAFLVVALRKQVARADTIKRTTVYWMPVTQASPRQLYAEVMDPSLMSLPNLKGYSRSLWQQGAPATHRSTAPGVELAYLEPGQSAALGTLLPQASLVEVMRATIEKPVSSPTEFTDASITEPVTFATQTVFRLEGPLVARALAHHPVLPPIVAPAALRPTYLRIAVSTDGAVRYVTLLRSAGNEEADAKALALAEEFRFEPTNRPDNHDLTWGVLRLLWAVTLPTTPTPPTN
jgi:TonB family protein